MPISSFDGRWRHRLGGGGLRGGRGGRLTLGEAATPASGGHAPAFAFAFAGVTVALGIAADIQAELFEARLVRVRLSVDASVGRLELLIA